MIIILISEMAYFYNKKTEKEFDKLTFGNIELVNFEIWHFQLRYKFGIYYIN